MTIGSTDALLKIIQLIKTDVILTDKFAYGTAVSVATATNKTPIGINTDNEGIIINSLEDTILQLRNNNIQCNLLYLVPTGHNPTGISMSNERKFEVLELCKRYNIKIIEDDAYYYLHYGNDNEMPGIKNLPKTIYSMDLSLSNGDPQTVIRLDSLSKFIGPGMRLGWICGSQQFIEKYLLLQEISSQFPCGLSQSIFLELTKHWNKKELEGGIGIHKHIQAIQEHYKNQRDVMINAIKEYLPTDLIEYNIPTAGMFIWLHFKFDKLNKNELSSFEIFKHLANNGVIIVPGGDFYVPDVTHYLNNISINNNNNNNNEQLNKYDPSIIRLTFAAASSKDIIEAMKRMNKALSTI